MVEIDRLISESLKGDKHAVARLISIVERGLEPTPYILERYIPIRERLLYRCYRPSRFGEKHHC